jgi:GH35 family endo-1,4-beta-xylanase
MRCIKFFSACLILMTFLAADVFAQPLPTGPRLKDIVTTMKIGVRTDQEGLFGSISPTYTTVYNREFNSGTVTCYPAWEAWTGVKQYNLTNINNRVNYLEDRGKTQMMHLLVGPSMYFPDWFKNGTYTNAQLEDMLQDWIRSIIQSNSNNTKVEVWNVVNEAIGWSAPGNYPPDSDVKWQQLGWEADASGLTGADKVNNNHPVYIRKAFEYARQYTNAKLELRDSGAEFPDGANSYKYKAFYQLTKHLLNKGVPLNAVGFQVHIDIGTSYNWEGFRNNINRFKALGLETYITELDIGDTQSSWNSTKAEQQRAMYYTVTQIAKETGMQYVHFWGMIDGLDTGWRTTESPLLFDSSYSPKPAYYGVQQALQDGGTGNLITVRASGVVGDEQMQVQIDGVAVKTWTLFTSMQNFTCGTSSTSGNLKVAFINDQGSRDVQVDYIKANGITYQAENQQVNTGVYQGQCGGSYSEWLNCNGYIDFGTIQFGATNNPPSVSLTSPANGATFTEGANIVMNANASDSDGSVTKVEFFSGSTKIGEDTSSPYSVTWSSVPAGSYTLTAKATDNGGATTTSTGVNITVNPPNPGGTNLLVNGGFESGTSSWSGQGCSISASSTAHSGSGSALTSGRSAAWAGPIQTITAAVASNGQGNYNVSAWIKMVSGSATVRVSIKLVSSGGGTTYPGIQGSATTSWSQISGQVNLTWSGTLTTAQLYLETTSGTTNFYADDCSIAAVVPNLLTNGGFESGISGWAGQGCTIAASTTVHSGSGSVLASSRTGSWAGPIQTITSGVAANGQGNYSVSAWMKMASGSATGSVTIKLVSGAGTTYTLVQGTVTTSWSQISGTANLTWSGTLTSADLYLETTSGTTSFYADDCSIKRSLSKPVIEENTQEIAALPVKHTLLQNFPNPFNPQTTITYELGERDHVQIEVYNLRGQLVDILADAVQESGTHQVVFQAQHLESGMYVYKMKAGVFTDSKKMIFVK